MASEEFSTVLAALQYQAEQFGEREALVFRDRHSQRKSLTWVTLYSLSGRFAATLRQGGVRARGDLVVSTLPNSPERAVCEMGIWMSGAAAVNGMCQLEDGSDFLRTLKVSRASAVVLDPERPDGPWRVLRNLVQVSEEGDVLPSPSCAAQLPDLKKVVFARRGENGDGAGDFLAGLRAQEDWFQAEDVQTDDTLTVFTTSGTTGFSKLVKHPHTTFISVMRGIPPGVATKVVEFSLAPMGWMGGCLAYLVVMGCKRVTCDFRAGNPEDMALFIWETLRVEQCTQAIIPPVHLQRVAEMAEKEAQGEASPPTPQPPPLDMLVLAGFPVSRSMVETSFRLSKSVSIAYGGTEFGFISFYLLKDSHDYVDHDSGPLLPGVEVKIVSLSEKTKKEKEPEKEEVSGEEKREKKDVAEGEDKDKEEQEKTADMEKTQEKEEEEDLTQAKDKEKGEEKTKEKHEKMVDVAQRKDKDEEEEKKAKENSQENPPVNTLGEILVKKQSLKTIRYLHDPQAMRAAFTADGFFHTGDMGRLDERGHLLVEGRAGDAIKRGAYIIYPYWLEKRLRGLIPGLVDVAIVGVPDPHVHEELCACLVLKDSAYSMEQVRQLVEKDIVTAEEDPMSPRPRFYLRFDAFPSSYTDKVKRSVIREQAALRLGLSALRV